MTTDHTSVVAICGLPGCGKTTVFQALQGLTWPWSVHFVTEHEELVSDTHSRIKEQSAGHAELTTALAYILNEYAAALRVTELRPRLVLRDRALEDTLLVAQVLAARGKIPESYVDTLHNCGLLAADRMVLLETEFHERMRRLRSRGDDAIGVTARAEYESAYGLDYAAMVSRAVPTTVLDTTNLTVEEVTDRIAAIVLEQGAGLPPGATPAMGRHDLLSPEGDTGHPPRSSEHPA